MIDNNLGGYCKIIKVSGLIYKFMLYGLHTSLNLLKKHNLLSKYLISYQDHQK